MNARLKALALSAVAAMSLGLAACGSDDQSPTGEEGNSGSTVAETSGAEQSAESSSKCDAEFTSDGVAGNYPGPRGYGAAVGTRFLTDEDMHLMSDPTAQKPDFQGLEYSYTEFLVGWQDMPDFENPPETLENVEFAAKHVGTDGSCTGPIPGSAELVWGGSGGLITYHVTLEEPAPPEDVVSAAYIMFDNPYLDGERVGAVATQSYDSDDIGFLASWSLLQRYHLSHSRDLISEQ